MSEPERAEARFYELVERYQREHPDLDVVYAHDWAREMLEPDEFERCTI
jgi:hypothetical protein